MQYLTGILTALVLSILAYGLVVLTMNLAIRRLATSGGLPVLPKYSPDKQLLISGLDFEEFVVERFDPGHFRILKWSKKYGGGDSAAGTDPAPDLEYQALVHRQTIPFAIECAWRPGFTDGAIPLSGIQLCYQYRKTGSDKNIPVFLIIGIGGTQAEPAECFIVPMELIQPHSTVLSREFLEPFRRQQAGSVLFLDTKQMKLH